ncbi:K02A2.6-like, partial [Cordylochernes scorpioides]
MGIHGVGSSRVEPYKGTKYSPQDIRSYQQPKLLKCLIKHSPNDAPKRTTVSEWHSRFKAGRISIEDDPRQERPKFQRTDENVQKITDLIKENPRTTLLELEQDTGISKTTIGRIVTEDLKLKKTPAKCIPRFLTNEQKLCRLATCEDMMEMTRTDPEWKDKIITGDETWVYGYDPETKPQFAEEFEEKNDNFCSFIERLEQFLILEEASEEKKKAYLLTLIGGKAYETLKNLCSPKLPKEYKYEELIEKLVEYFSPRRSIIVERFMFFGRIQKETESVSEYLVEIKRLASTCGFGEFLKESLRDKLVCGLRNAKIQRRILSEGDVPLARVVEIALSMEAAEKNTRIFHVNEPADSVDKIRAEVGNRYNREQKRKCIHCGRLHKDLCRFREATCFRCGKRGHLATICRSRGEHTSERQVSRFLNQRKINQIEDQEEEESVQRMVFMRTYDYRVKYATNDPPYVIKMRVEDTLMTFEIDTGSCLTLISEKDFKRYLPDVQVKEAGIIVKTYDGTVVPILGEIDVKVDFRGTIAKLRAVV